VLVKQALIDTDILSLFFRGDSKVVAQFSAYTAVYGRMNIGIITYYEIVSGLKHRNLQKQLAAFFDFAAQSYILPLTEESVVRSADVYARLRTQGTPLDDIDLLIAGTALAKFLCIGVIGFIPFLTAWVYLRHAWWA
jgi:tRNA(fMet)-specific endonuclease VapC